MPGHIRVGRIEYIDGKAVHPQYPGFTPIVVLTKSSPYGSLGPYELRDDNGRIMENIWQFSKVYEKVEQVAIPYTKAYPKIVWRWPAATHVDANGNLTDDYWRWREAGMANTMAVRYPPGAQNMNKCLYAIQAPGGPKLDYITSRRLIYAPVYMELVQKQRQFAELKKRHEDGEDLLIIEVDGPHERDLVYYMDKYRVGDDFIVSSTMLATPENLRIMRDDPEHAFGHGYCLAMALLGLPADF